MFATFVFRSAVTSRAANPFRSSVTNCIPKSWVTTPSSNNGILFVNDTRDRAGFVSSEGNDPERPLLTVTFVLPATPVVEEVQAGWDPAADADAATATLIGFGQQLVSIGIWVGIVGIPIGIGFAILIAFTVLAWRVARRPQAGVVEP